MFFGYLMRKFPKSVTFESDLTYYLDIYIYIYINI